MRYLALLLLAGTLLGGCTAHREPRCVTGPAQDCDEWEQVSEGTWVRCERGR